MKSSVDEVIILRRVNFGESDRVITFLGKNSGKVSAFAKGVRKQKSKLSSGLELLNINEVGIIEGKSNLKTLTSSRIIIFNENIVKDFDKTNSVFIALKLITMLIEDNEGQEYYDILKTYLLSLNEEELDKRLVEVWFTLKLLEVSGVMPDIVVESEDKDVRFYFDYERQVFVGKNSGDFIRNDIKLLRVLKQNPKPVKLAAPCDSEDLLMNFSKTLLENNLG